MKPDTPAQKLNEFVITAITNGARHDIKNNEGTKKIIFYEDDGKTVYAIIKYSNGKLKEKQTFLDGNLAYVTAFNDDGSFKNTRFPFNDEFNKVTAKCDIIIDEKSSKENDNNTQN